MRLCDLKFFFDILLFESGSFLDAAGLKSEVLCSK